MKKQFLFSLCFLAITFSSCGQKLSKSEALKVIKSNNLVHPCHCKINTSIQSNMKTYSKHLKIYKALQEKRIITTSSYRDRLSQLDRTGYTVVKMEPLDKATYQYSFEKIRGIYRSTEANVLYSTPKITEVLGISSAENSREAVVLIKIVYDLSPFAGLVNKSSSQSNCNNKSIEEREITLIKYDTGWRIKK